VCDAPAVNLDIFPTCLAAAGLTLPRDRVVDGRDITPLLTGESAESPHDYLYLYHHGELEGVRSGRWKYFRSTNHYTWPMPVNRKLGRLANHTEGPTPLLFDLSTDPGEAYDLSQRFPEVVAELEAAMEAWQEAVALNPLGFGNQG
jgi:arylsulfatase A-like enzyme